MLPASIHNNQRDRGFALIATLAVAALLVLLVTGLLAVSMQAVKKENSFRQQEMARSNARLSLALAIGELQKQTGPDTRVTAGADILDPGAPRLTGVWRSWEGMDHDSRGRPVAPDYDAKRQPVSASGNGRFQKWLVSTDGGPGADVARDPRVEAAKSLAFQGPAVGGASVPMVSSGTLGQEELATGPVHLPTVKIAANGRISGGIAWWIGGENRKANVKPDPKPGHADTVAWQERARAHTVPDPTTFGLAKPPDFALPTAGTMAVTPGATAATAGFHDATVWSMGLLANAATGGWKRDLSLMTEKWDELPPGGLPFFTLKPGEELRFSKAAPPQTSPGSHPDNPLLYWWSQYSANPTEGTFAQIPPIVSWDYLRNACVQYRSLIALDTSSGRTGMPWALESWWNTATRKYRYEFLDQPRRWPALSRIYFMYSFAAVPDATNPANLKAAIMMNPVVVLWNPYNVEITLDARKRFVVNTVAQEILPMKFSFNVGTTRYPAISFNQITGISNIDMFLIGANGGSTTLNPGETRVFSVKDDIPVDGGTGYLKLDLYPGYRTYGGFRYLKIGPSKTEVSAPKDSDFNVDLTFDALLNKDGRTGYGSALDFGYDTLGGNSTDNNFSHRTSRQYIVFNQQVARALWPPIPAGNLPSCKLSEVLGNRKNRLFITGVVGFRTANDSVVPGKGCVQSNPLNYFNDLSEANTLGVPVAGIQHPANSSYDIQFINGGDISARPNVEPATNRGYIVSGLDASSGLTGCVAAEIPARPVQSLFDLQHFDLRNGNPMPPFQFNILGNSQASPLLPSDHVIRPEFGDFRRMQHDDSYCLNHLFFDDWFVSSIAPDLKDWTNQTERDLETVYKDFLGNSRNPETGAPLPNNMFRPTPEALNPEPVQACERDVKPADSYRTIASKLTIDGMFNANSTSVKAWQALLGHALGQRQPYIAGSGTGWQVALAPRRDHAVSRLSVAGGGAAGIDTPPPQAFADALEFAGHRCLGDREIEALAEEIVAQVRRRGPFLSLSEFVNRQLGSANNAKDLALAGTVQAALDALAARGPGDPANPYREIQKNSRHITRATINSMPASGDADYLFPEAAEGCTANGVPGWLRQADILRPLAPVLAARDDTFTIRSYGEARDASGKVTARSWCEAVVRRTPDFLDPSDPDTDTPVIGTDTGTEKFLQSEINARFGRRYIIVAFRWLTPEEV